MSLALEASADLERPAARVNFYAQFEQVGMGFVRQETPDR